MIYPIPCEWVGDGLLGGGDRGSNPVGEGVRSLELLHDSCGNAQYENLTVSITVDLKSHFWPAAGALARKLAMLCVRIIE